MTPIELLEQFKQEAENKGFSLHADHDHCLHTVESLLENKARYGYMNCPCRLAKEDIKQDIDIICPCKYREEDIQEQGACFCSFFVSKEYKDDADFFPDVDDRRPPELS